MFARSRRLVRTVVFTDIVGSTELASRFGDRPWRQLQRRHHEAIRRELRRHHGREIDTAGDGFLIVFENPTDGITAAAAMVAAAHELGLQIRAGIHTGELETAGEKPGGMAVHIAARLLSVAGPGEVLVSGTVRDLAVGSAHEFVDRGEQDLRGVPGRWRVYALDLPGLEPPRVAVGEARDGFTAPERGRRRLVIAGVAVAVAVIGGAVALAGGTTPVATGAGTVMAYTTGSDAPVAGWFVGRGPAALASADGTLWIADIDAGTIARTDMLSGATATFGQSGSHPSSIIVSNGSVWVADRYADQLTLLSAETGALVRQARLHASAMAMDGRWLWVADDLRDRLLRVDPETLIVEATLELPAPSGPAALVAQGAAMWVAAPRATGLLRVDVGSGDTDVLPVQVDGVSVVAGADNFVWVASGSTDTVARIEAASGRVAARANVCDVPVALAPVGNGVWVACASDPDNVMWRLDESGAVIQQIALDAVPAALSSDGERVWVALRGD